MSRVLFVEDEEVLGRWREAFKAQAMLWDLDFAADLEAAFGALAAHPTDLVVGGTEVLRHVRDRFPDTARLLYAKPSEAGDLASTITIAHQFVGKPSSPDDVLDAIRRALRLREQTTSQKVRSDITDLSTLPTPSPVFARLLEVIESESSEARDVAEIVSQDVGLTAKVLQLVNSSFFAPRSRITSVDLAVVRLGRSVIRTLALLDGVTPEIREPAAVRDWCAVITTHSYEVATVARQLAEREIADDAFCGGLLHECGQLVFAHCRPDVFAAHLDLREQNNVALSDLEQHAFGVTHAQAGAYLLNLWGCPIDVIDAVAAHDLDVLSRNERVQVVQVAHRLVERSGRSLCGKPHPEADDLDWLDGSYFANRARAFL